MDVVTTACRPGHRAAGRHAGRRRRAGGRGGARRSCRRPISACSRTPRHAVKLCNDGRRRHHVAAGRRPYRYRPLSHPARGRSGGASRTRHHAAGAQRCRQDHDAAHHHGPVAGSAGPDHVRPAIDITALATPHIARLGIAYVPENMGIFAQADGTREHAACDRAAAASRNRDLDRVFDVVPGAQGEMELGRGLAVRRAEADAGDRRAPSSSNAGSW